MWRDFLYYILNTLIRNIRESVSSIIILSFIVTFHNLVLIDTQDVQLENNEKFDSFARIFWSIIFYNYNVSSFKPILLRIKPDALKVVMFSTTKESYLNIFMHSNMIYIAFVLNAKVTKKFT